MEITFRFLFVIITYFLFCPNYVICLFHVVTLLDDVSITLFSYVWITYGNDVKITFRFNLSLWRISYFVTITFRFFSLLQRIFITSQLCYLSVRCSYVSWWRYNYVIFWYVRITYGNNVIITFRFCSSF